MSTTKQSDRDLWGTYVFKGTDYLKNKLIPDSVVVPSQEMRTQIDSQINTITKKKMQLLCRHISGLNFKNTVLDAQFLSAIHKKMFEDVYSWAGQYRVTGIARGSSHFCQANIIDAAAQKVLSKQLSEHKSMGEFIDLFAKRYADLNYVHPFRDGNGRSTRIYMYALACQSGYHFDVDKVFTWDSSTQIGDMTKEAFAKKQWNDACKMAMPSKNAQTGRMEAGDLSELKRILSKGICTQKAWAFECMSEDLAVNKYPDLKNAFNEFKKQKQAIIKGADTLASIGVAYSPTVKAKQIEFKINAMKQEFIRKINANIPIGLAAQHQHQTCKKMREFSCCA